MLKNPLLALRYQNVRVKEIHGHIILAGGKDLIHVAGNPMASCNIYLIRWLSWPNSLDGE